MRSGTRFGVNSLAFVFLSSAAGCGSSPAGDSPDAAPPPPPTCTGKREIIADWQPEGLVLPSITVPGDGFYGLAHDYQRDLYSVRRYAPTGAASTVATLPVRPLIGAATTLLSRDATLHYEFHTDAEIHHGPLGGPEAVIPTGGRRVITVQAVDRGGLFVAFRDTSSDTYHYTVYDGTQQRFVMPSSWDTTVHPRTGALPVLARLSPDHHLFTAVAGEPMAELPRHPACAPSRPYAVLALADGTLAWAHACPPDNPEVGSLIAVRAPTGEVTWKTFASLAPALALAEGPDGDILAGFLTEPGELRLFLYDTQLDERSRGSQSAAEVVSGPGYEYKFPLSSITLSGSTIGSSFVINGRFDIPDGRIEKLAFGTLCAEE